MGEKVENILSGLNPEQQAAASCVEGPVLIVAGAGSGKTRVLTTRIAYLIGEKGVSPDRILALTFTKKAAGEMKERIAVLVGERQARRIWMGTFHSVFIRFLREYADRIGYPAAFTIYDQSDSQSAIKTCIRQLELDDKIYKPREVQNRISMAKNGLFTAEAYAGSEKAREADRLQKKPELYRIFQLYEQTCRQNGVMDFDDILLNMNILLKVAPDAAAAIAGRFDHILVDEYQDTNLAQYRILRELSKGKRNICVVGDDSQSIYAFRGANIGNILHFQQDFPGCHLFRLESNYRSTQNIVGASNSLIAKNEGRIPKQCRAVGPEGEKIRLLRAYSEMEEATQVTATIIARMREEHAEYRDFAILYRTNAQSRALEEALRKRNLPYVIFSGNSFFERAEVKDMMAYLKLVVNPADNESFKRVVNKPARGIGETSLHALEEAARAAGKSLTDTAFLESVEGLRDAALTKIRTFAEMIRKLHALVETTDAYDLVTRIADESGLYLFYKSDSSIEGQARTANVEELVNSVARFVEDRKADIRAGLLADGSYDDETEIPDEAVGTVLLGDFLEDISLLSNADTPSDDNDTNKIALMTAHSAKGLEFPHVFVVGMEENLFPSMSMLFSAKDIEEERRLFYVAMTRAKKTVTFTYCESRMRNGKHESNLPSRFLREIDDRYLANPLHQDDGTPSESGIFRGRSPWGGSSRGGASWGDGASRGSASWGDGASRGGASWGDGASRGSASWGDGASRGGASWGDGASRGGASWDDGASRGGERNGWSADRDADLDRKQRAYSSEVRYIPRQRPAAGATSGRPGAGATSGRPGDSAYTPTRSSSAARPGSGATSGRPGSSAASLSSSASRRPLPPGVIPAGSPLTAEALRNRPLPDKIPDAEFEPVTMDRIVAGIRIEHNRFGFGTVLEVTGRIPDLKAKICFDQFGEKILLLKFAKLRLPAEP